MELTQWCKGSGSHEEPFSNIAEMLMYTPLRTRTLEKAAPASAHWKFCLGLKMNPSCFFFHFCMLALHIVVVQFKWEHGKRKGASEHDLCKCEKNTARACFLGHPCSGARSLCKPFCWHI
jgi:hypothetical protein